MLGKLVSVISAASLVFAASGGAVELRLKWQEGKSYKFAVSSSQAMTMAMGGNVMATQAEVEQSLRYDAYGHEKGTEVLMQFESMSMTMRVNGQPMMSYDSEKDGGGGVLGASMKPLFDMTVTTIYDREGKIVEIGGLEGLQGMEQLGMGKDELEVMVRESSLMMPGGEVEPGDTWNVKMDLPLGQLSKEPAVMEFELKFEGMQEVAGKPLARITLDGKVAMEADAEAAAPLQLVSKSVSGEIFFDVELGQPRESRMKMELEMGLPANVPLAEGAPGKMPLSIMTTQKLLAVGDAKEKPAE